MHSNTRRLRIAVSVGSLHCIALCILAHWPAGALWPRFTATHAVVFASISFCLSSTRILHGTNQVLFIRYICLCCVLCRQFVRALSRAEMPEALFTVSWRGSMKGCAARRTRRPPLGLVCSDCQLKFSIGRGVAVFGSSTGSPN